MRRDEQIEIRPLGGEDVPVAMRLKNLARWNQTEEDWQRLLNLDPRGCFAATIGGQVVATTTTTTYERHLAWIGMVLVDPDYRRRGIATRLMRGALEYLRGEKVATVKLDATPDGRPVYESLGFEVELLIERWSGVARTVASSDCTKLDASILPEVFALDRRAFGADRSKLIELLVSDATTALSVSNGLDRQLNGYALSRRGTTAAYVGPVVASDAATATALLDGVLNQLAGEQVYVDVNTAFASGTRELAARGFVKQRDLIRMRYGEKNGAGTSPTVFAIAGPEVG
ncbi:MAG TPA: GNAT family N-acetyltransferase [Pyrinomonadaceae bacterium]|nr:GNAT family N-acetyltransferase [Pyrinomonadaceae bacterium]